MLKSVGQTFLGLLVTFTGIYILYYYITGIDYGSSPWLLALSLPIIGGGVFILLRAGKSDDTIMAKMKNKMPEPPSTFDGLEDTLEKNNSLTKDWAKTNEARNRLRILELSTEAQEKR